MVQHPGESPCPARNGDSVDASAHNAHVGCHVGERLVCVPAHRTTGEGAKDRPLSSAQRPLASNDVVGDVGTGRRGCVVDRGDQVPREVAGDFPDEGGPEACIAHDRTRRDLDPPSGEHRIGVSRGSSASLGDGWWSGC